jgi:hypothetical protein
LQNGRFSATEQNVAIFVPVVFSGILQHCKMMCGNLAKRFAWSFCKRALLLGERARKIASRAYIIITVADFVSKTAIRPED